MVPARDENNLSTTLVIVRYTRLHLLVNRIDMSRSSSLSFFFSVALGSSLVLGACSSYEFNDSNEDSNDGKDGNAGSSSTDGGGDTGSGGSENPTNSGLQLRGGFSTLGGKATSGQLRIVHAELVSTTRRSCKGSLCVSGQFVTQGSK